MFLNRMSLQMLRQLIDKTFTNPFPVKGMPDDLGGALEAAAKGDITLNPPVDENLQDDRRFRGRVAYDKSKCIGCRMCIKVCPANAISYIEEEKKIQVHSDRCCFCAQCTEICPVNCLAMSDESMFSSYVRKEQVVTDSGKFDIKMENVVKVVASEPSLAEEEMVEEEETAPQAKYEIDPEKCIGCTKCARICPVNAIEGKVKEPHVIDKDKCVACGQCAEGCPVGAISLEDLSGGEEVGEPEAEKKEATEAPAVEEKVEEKPVKAEEKPAPKKAPAKKTTRKTPSRRTAKKKEEPEKG